MKQLLNKGGLILIVMGIAAYIWMLNAQEQAAAELCARYPVGSRIENLANLEGTSRLKQMGPVKDPNNPGTGSVIFCAGLTMCDTSCSIEIEDNIVKSARFTNY